MKNPEPGSKEYAEELVEQAKAIGELVAEKQVAYGDSFGQAGACLRRMYPKGIRPDQYDDMLTITRILDKLFRIAADKTAFEENPYRDINGYSLLGVVREEITKRLQIKKEKVSGVD